jgi:tetratricopeptide (TPR) repeat protein
VNSFLPSYHDPVFSIILIVLIAMAIALVTHAWGVYRRERLSRSLYSFLDRFDTTSCSLEEEEVPFEEGMAKPLLLLARAFEQSGNYAKTISICLYLIRHTKDDELLIYLGKVYLRAGFYQRAEEIFLEILSRHPRRPDVLIQLEYLYESLQEYDKAREALEALTAQGEETKALEAHLAFLEIRGDKELRPEEKRERLEALLDREGALYRPVLRELFLLDTSRAWHRVDPARVPEIVDILWYLPPAQLQLDIIAGQKSLEAIYFARGDLEEGPEDESGIFAVDMLCAARRGGYFGGTMSFSYLCTSCKQSFPVSFVRCPSCLALDSLNVEAHLVPSKPQVGDSLL